MKKTIYLFFALCLFVSIWQACELITTGGIYGTVLDKESGEPISNAEITLTPSGKTAVVGSNGTFEFVDLEEGIYSVNVEADGYDHNSKTAKVMRGENTTCDFHLIKTVVNQELLLTPTSLNFGTTQNQLSVTITNKGTEETIWSLNLGNNAWFSATPTTGRIAAGKTQTIVFSVNRTLITKDESAIVSLSAFGNSYPLTISCESNKGKLNVTHTVLNFGKNLSELSFSIKNIGKANMTWSVKGLTSPCLSLSEQSGNLAVGASKVVKLTLDRSLLDSDLSTSFFVQDGFTEQEIQVLAQTISSDPETIGYYIKHPWGSGLDEDWIWKQMQEEGDNYVCSGLWGGEGANINTIDAHKDAIWFSESNIEGAYLLWIGDSVKFTYNPTLNTLSVTEISNGNNTNKAQVRFCKEEAYQYVTSMEICQVPGGGFGTFKVAASYEFGTDAGVSPYYDINAQVSYCQYYNSYYDKYQFAFGDEYPEYTFEAGYKYTYSCGDDGEYLVFTITIDATFNAPAKVVATRRVHKMNCTY